MALNCRGALVRGGFRGTGLALAQAVPACACSSRAGAIEVVRGGAARARWVALDRVDPLAVDACFAAFEPGLVPSVRDHSAL